MSAATKVAQRHHLTSQRRTLLHWATAECTGRLDELAAHGMPATALCGYRGVPTRPGPQGWSPHAAVCLSCTTRKNGGAR